MVRRRMALVLVLALLGAVFTPSFGVLGSAGWVTVAEAKGRSTPRPKTQPVRGYQKKNGTHVAPYKRAPRR